MKKRVLIASANPVKINAAMKSFSRVFEGEEFDFEGLSVDSGVADQPIGIDETLLGATNRVEALKTKDQDADFYVGMEGGIQKRGKEYFAFAWMFVRSGNGKSGKAQTAHFQLPPPVVSFLEKGYELGDADDMVFGKQNSKQKSGAVGLLTGDLINRSQYYEHAMILALIPFKHTELF